MAKHDDSRLKCSFCGKTQDQVKKLIAGPEVYICDECVELCNEILDEEFFENKEKEGSSKEKGGKSAEKAGIKAGDVIVKADGQEIKTMTELNNIKNTHNIGDTMTVTVNRNGQEKEITLTLQEQ